MQKLTLTACAFAMLFLSCLSNALAQVIFPK